MEVHHHSHTARKKWTHYLWEFLMLFLAVFCGFLAENQREHYVEHQREKKYMKTMIQDLQADTASMGIIIDDFTNKIPSFDTIISELPKLATTFSAPFVRNFPKIMGYEDLVPNDRTLQQLKNAGGMRLIRKISVSDSIMAYDKKMKDLLIEQEAISGYYTQLHSIGELINSQLFARAWNNPDVMKQFEENNMILLVSPDKSLLSKYLGYAYSYQSLAGLYLKEIKEVFSQAVRLIGFIRMEYHDK